MNPGLYYLVRKTDISGVCGTGRVAQIAVFDDGSCVIRWLTDKSSVVFWAKWPDMKAVNVDLHPDGCEIEPIAPGWVKNAFATYLIIEQNMGGSHAEKLVDRILEEWRLIPHE